MGPLLIFPNWRSCMEIVETLRKLAGDLRKAAEIYAEYHKGEELDSEKIRDFLIFYGRRDSLKGAANG